MSKWHVEELSGKFYGTQVVSDDGKLIQVWIGFTNYTPEEVSVREKARGWDHEERGFDHVESSRDFEAALAIAHALTQLNI